MKRGATEPPEVKDEEWDDEEEVDEEERLIAEETLVDAGGDYQFRCMLRRHYEYESVMMVSVTIMHGERSSLSSVMVGSVKALLVDRDFRPRWQFHELCDGESQELQEMGVLFCNDDGTVRYKDIDGLDARADGAASHGGFLQIEMVRLVEAHRHKDVGVRCIKALLEWMNAREGGRESTLRWGAEYNTLHSSWTLAALEPGLETTEEDWGRARRSAQEEQPSAEEEAHEEERKAQTVIANRKVALQWARLGFCQAKFASSYWYLTPSRACLKTKAEVAELNITKTPKVPPTAEADKPLCEYFFRCAEEGRPATFEQDVRRLVAEGADLNRMHALHRALTNGIAAEADFKLLVSLGADPTNTDEMGQTALHLTANLVGRGEDTKARAVVAAKALTAVGVRCSVLDVHGDTALQTVIKQLRYYEDFNGAFNLGKYDTMHAQSGRDSEKHPFELMVALLEPAQRDTLLGGVLTPRQRKRLEFYIEIKNDEATTMTPEFTKYKPRPSEDMEMGVPYWEHIPQNVRGTEVFKSFVHGWAQVFEAAKEILCPRDLSRHTPALPTVGAVTNELTGGRYKYDDRYTSHFFGKGGRVEHVLDGLLHETMHSEVFFDTYMGEFAEEGDDQEYNGLPEHPLDDCWNFVRYHFLGPKGLVPEGPFESLDGENNEEMDSEDD